MAEQKDFEVQQHLIAELLREKRADRRWRNIRFLAWFLLILFIIFNLFTFSSNSMYDNNKTGYVALIRLDGMIAPGRGFSAQELIPNLHDAFADKNAKGVVIDINSPGGTPVQAAIIHDAILYYKKKFHKKVIIVGEDLLTSGAYYVAVSGDKIYVNPNTLTGSIGVIMKGFGFVDLLKKVGIERRVYTAGIDKDRLDPFLPQNQNDIQKITQVTGEVHQNFTKAVMEGRKGRLKADPKIVFNGDFWTGQTALRFGLVDGLGNLMDVMTSEFKTTRYKEYGGSSNFLKMLTGQLGSTFDSYMGLST